MGISASIGVAASGKPSAGDQANAVLSGVLIAVGPTAPFAFRGPMNLEIYASYNSALTTAIGSLAASVAVAGTVAKGNSINSANVPPGTVVGAIAGTAITLVVPPVSLTGFTDLSQAEITGLARTDGMVGATVTGPGIPAATTVLAVSIAAVAPGGNNAQGTLGVVQLSKQPTLATQFRDKPDVFSFARTGNAIQTTGADANAIFTGTEIVYSGTIQLERSFDGCSTWLPANIGGSGAIASYNAGTPVSLTFGEPEKQVYYRLNCIAFVSGTINYRVSQTGGAAESLSIGPLI